VSILRRCGFLYGRISIVRTTVELQELRGRKPESAAPHGCPELHEYAVVQARVPFHYVEIFDLTAKLHTLNCEYAVAATRFLVFVFLAVRNIKIDVVSRSIDGPCLQTHPVDHAPHRYIDAVIALNRLIVIFPNDSVNRIVEPE